MTRVRIPLVRFYFYTQLPSNQGSPPPRVSADPAKDCWIYVFEVSHARATLLHEIEVTEKGQYRLVDLDKHLGKYPRPATPRLLDGVPMRATETLRGKEVALDYWILSSPFQLHPSRLPDMGGKQFLLKSDPRWNALFTWFRKDRELEYAQLEKKWVEKSDREPWKLYLWSPWTEAFAYQDEFRRALELIDKHEVTRDARINLRYLYTAVRALGDDARLAKYIDLGAFDKTRFDLKGDDAIYQRAEIPASQLGNYLKSPRFESMHLDTYAGDEQKNQAKYRPIVAAANHRLEETKAGRDYQLEFYRKNTPFFLFEFKDFKVLRKGVKAEWNLLKVPVAYAAGDNDKQVSLAMAERVKKFSRKFAGVELFIHIEELKPGESAVVSFAEAAVPDPNFKPPTTIRFSDESVQRLKRKTTERPSLNGLVAVVDLINAVAAFVDFLEVMRGKHTETSKTIKAGAAFVGALSSALSSANGVASSLAPDDLAVKSYDKLRAAAGDDAAALERAIATQPVMEAEALTRLTRSRMTEGMVRVVRNRRFKAILGALGGLADMASGTVDASRGFEKGDLVAGWCGVATVLGGVVTMAGAYFTIANPPIGAVLVFLGSAISMGATFFATYFSSTEVEDWLRQSPWGIKRKFSDPMQTVSTNDRYLSDQIDSLHEALFVLKVSCDFARNTHLEVSVFSLKVSARQLDRDSVVWLEVVADGEQGQVVLRPFSPWKNARLLLGPNGTYDGLEQTFDTRGLKRVRGKVQIDVVGDQRIKHPAKERTFDFAPSLFTI